MLGKTVPGPALALHDHHHQIDQRVPDTSKTCGLNCRIAVRKMGVDQKHKVLGNIRGNRNKAHFVTV